MRTLATVKLDIENLIEKGKAERKARKQARKAKLAEYPNPLRQIKNYWQGDVFICDGKKFELDDDGQTVCKGKLEVEISKEE